MQSAVWTKQEATILGQTYTYGLYEFTFDEDIYYSTLFLLLNLQFLAENWPCQCTDTMAACGSVKDQSGIDESQFDIIDITSQKDQWNDVLSV